jgi:Flp pilus assembly protein TadD
LRLRLARAKLGFRNWHEAVAESTHVLDRRPNDDTARACRGSAFAELGRWNEAAADLEACARLKPEDKERWYRLGLARLGAGDEAGFRDVCRQMLDRFRDTHDPDMAGSLAYLAGQMPNAGLPPETLVTLAERAHAAHPDGATYLQGLGNALFRSGRYTEAITRLHEAATRRNGDYRPEMALVLAMAHHRLAGPTDSAAVVGLLAGPHGPLQAAAGANPQALAARHWLHRADELLRADEHPGWEVGVMRRVLRAEAGRMLGVDPPGQTPPP